MLVLRYLFHSTGRIRILATALILIVATSRLYTQDITFSNVAEDHGIKHTYFLTAAWGGGTSFFDYNRDGFDDLLLATGDGEKLHVYQSDGNGFIEIANSLNLLATEESQSVLWVDYDNDGDQDLFVANYEAGVRLYRRDAPWTFSDITPNSNLPVEGLTVSAACWADYDRDGFIDLYITNRHVLQENMLFRNLGDDTFEDVSLQAAIGDSGQAPLAVSFLDYDNDGWQDIYIANDRGTFTEGNTLYQNQGDGTFANVSAETGTNLQYDAMGIAIGDYDNNGYLDMYISNGPAGNGLLHNNGDGTFSEIAEPLGIAVNLICWGVNFFDFDNDTDLDLYVCVSRNGDSTNVLFENLGDGSFSDASSRILNDDNFESYSVSSGDFNNDGYEDMVVLNEASSTCLWENSGGENNWIKVRLEGTTSNRDAVGSLLYFYVDGQRYVRSTHCGISYLGQNSSTITLGIGSATMVDSLVIYWPSGASERFNELSVNQLQHIVEGVGIVGIEQNAARLPTEIKLHQNYPNPFNPETVIQWESTTSGVINLVIYDINGKHVKTLVNNQRLTKGSFIATWDGKNELDQPVSSGVYIYQLSSNTDYLKAKKMMLLK